MLHVVKHSKCRCDVVYRINCAAWPAAIHASLAEHYSPRRRYAGYSTIWTRFIIIWGEEREESMVYIYKFTLIQSECDQVSKYATTHYRALKKSFLMVGRMLQAGWGRRGKQQHEQNSPNHLQRLFLGSVCFTMVLWFFLYRRIGSTTVWVSLPLSSMIDVGLGHENYISLTFLHVCTCQ